MKKYRRILCVFMAASMAVAGLAACSGGKDKKSSSASGEGELTVLLPPWAEPSQELIHHFEEEHGTKVNLNIMGWDEIHDKITVAAVSKVAPADVMEVDWSWTKEFISADCVEPFELTDEQKEEYPLYTSFEEAGNVVAIPYLNDIRVGYYNEEHLKAAQITETPRTWKELVEDCVKIKEAGICEYPLSFTLSATEHSANQLLWLSLCQGIPFFREDDSIDGQKMEATLKLVDEALNETKIIDPASISLTDVEADSAYRKGNATFLIGAMGTLGTCNNPEESSVVGQVKTMLIPGTESIQTATYGLPEGIGISKYSKNKELAKEFIEWFTGDEVQTYLYQKHGTVPSSVKTFEKLGTAGEIADEDILMEELKADQSPFPNGVPGWYSEYSSIVANKLNALAQGTLDSKEAAEQIVKEVDGIAK